MLIEAKVGESVRVEGSTNNRLALLLTDMGCPIGSIVQVYQPIRKKHPIAIQTSAGNLLALRYDEAQTLSVSKV